MGQYSVQFARGFEIPTRGRMVAERSVRVSRRALHAVMALILVVCLVCPYVETALGWDGNIFTTGNDSETTLAVIILLVELILALTGVLSVFLPNARANEHVAQKSSRLTCESAFRFSCPDASPPVPLRI